METSMIDPHWRDLYRIAGIAVIISGLVIILGFVTYFIWPYAPGKDSTESIFLVLQSNPLRGLLSLDLFLFIGNLFGIVLFLALYVSLRQVNESVALIAVVVGLLSLLLLIPARPIPELFALSKAYGAATSETEKTQYIIQGGTFLAAFDGINWYMNTLLGGLSLLTSSVLMLRSKLFSKATAYMGIVTNLVLCCFIFPPIRLFALFLCLPGYLIWYFLLARRFFEMARGDS